MLEVLKGGKNCVVLGRGSLACRQGELAGGARSPPCTQSTAAIACIMQVVPAVASCGRACSG
eukprot:17900-Chlamydomonas_euryale.AAC.1